MAVDQARHLNFFREMLFNSNNGVVGNTAINPIQIGSNNNNSNNNNIANSLALLQATTTAAAAHDSSLLLPFYNLNDVVFAGKLQPAVKDDSGVTFNNNVVPATVPSRKRMRESPAVLPAAPMMMSSGGVGTVPNSLVSSVNTIASVSGAVVNNKESAVSNGGFSFLGEDISLQIMQQQLELDRLISQHMEKMRMEIEDRKKQQLRRIMAAIEEAMAKKLQEKEQEIDKIGKINWALEERVKSLYLENQIWRDLAQTNEATANALRSNLEQVLHQVRENVDHRHPDLTDDAVSCCGSSGYGVEDKEEEDDVNNQQQKKRRLCDDGKKWIYRGKNCEGENNNSGNGSKRLCKKCGEGESSVLLLPCRHLCLCTSCGPAVNACPICNSAKNASVHVNLS